MDKTAKNLRSWEKQKKLIPVMIRKYCKGNHGTEKGCLCDECTELTAYALQRLEHCPFKENKSFCSACKIHCYKPEMREKIRKVMRYSGPRMIWTHPIWSCSHVVTTIRYKKALEKDQKAGEKASWKI